MITLTTTPQIRLPIPRWMWLAAGAVVALGTLYLALYPLTLAWPVAAYLAIGQLHTVAFGVSALLLARLSATLSNHGSRWAARALLLSSLLAIGLDLQQRTQQREITEAAGIVVYVLVYLLNVVAVNCMFPRHQWHWRMALRRFSEVGIVMCGVYAALQFTLPKLIPGWSWSPELTLACFRFVSTIGLITSALMIYRRYFVAGRSTLAWGALGLGCMLVTDLLIFVMTDVIARGGSPRLMAVASPVWVIQHGCWLIALVQLRQSPLQWRDDPTVNLPHSPWAWARSTPSGLVIIALALMVGQEPDGTLWIWFVVALIGRELIVAYEREVATERQAAAQRDLEQAHDRIRHRIERAVMNVLVNALNAIDHDQGRVIVTLRVEDDIIVEVRDNGCGMDSDRLAAIRDRFAAIDQGKIPDSAGIGLNLSKRLIDAHGGRFTLTSVLNQGTTVTIALTRSRPPPEAPAARPTQA